MNHPQLKAILAQRGMPQWQLAQMLGIPPSTLSEYLRGTRTAPGGLAQRIESALRLRAGTLRNPGR